VAPLLFSASVAFAAAPEITSGHELSSDTGHVLVAWEADGPATLSISRDADLGDAQPLYQGNQQSYFLSGLESGEYYLQVVEASGARSQPVRLSIEHQSLTKALWLTLIGAIITLGIVVVIFRGVRR